MNCDNCGAELFSSQRFCRACGKPTEQFTEEHAPTQLMPHAGDTAEGRPLNTAPPPGHQTSPVYAPAPGYFASTPAPQHPLPPYKPPARLSGPLAWLVTLMIAGFIAVVAAGVFLSVRTRRQRNVQQATIALRVPDIPARPGEAMLGEEGALDDSGERRFTKSFAITQTPTVSINNLRGDIRIEGWDKPNAELEIVKRGGSVQDRKGVPIMYTNDSSGLALRTVSNRARVTVDYVLRIPRALKQIQIKLVDGDIELGDVNSDLVASTENGNINLRNVTGQITTNSKKGSLELEHVTGWVSANTVNGDVKASFDNIRAGKPLEFATMLGDIDIQFKPAVNLDIEAQTSAGEIDVDDDLGIEVKKMIVGQHATGKIGVGGQALKINTVKGNIRLSRAD